MQISRKKTLAEHLAQLAPIVQWQGLCSRSAHSCYTAGRQICPKCTVGDIFEVRSCGAQLSGMILGTNSSKSASATHPRRRFRTPSRACTNWHRNCPFNGTGSLTKEGVVTCHSQCDVLVKLWEKKTSSGRTGEFWFFGD